MHIYTYRPYDHGFIFQILYSMNVIKSISRALKVMVSGEEKRCQEC